MPADVTTRPRIQEYPSWERPPLISRLSDVTTQLVEYLKDYYRMQGDETRSKADAWMSSTETTVSGRQRDVDLATYHVSATILEIRGEIEALKLEREFILYILGDRSA